MAKAKNPIYGDFYNGIGISNRVQACFDDMTNCDVNTVAGSLLCQKALAQMDGGIVTEPCYQCIAPNGDTYFFSQTSGKIFKRTQAGVYSSVRTGVNGAYKGCEYYRGYIYYSMDAFLGRYSFGDVNMGNPTITIGNIAWSAITMTIASPCVVTLNSHGLSTGYPVSFTTSGALPTGLNVGTVYYVIYVNANTFQLATTLANAWAGTAITTTGSQSGTHTINRGLVYLANHGLYLGEPIYFTTTGGLPTGITASTTYYAIPFDSNYFNIASSYANAEAGIAIVTTGSQSGTQTLFRVSWNDNFQALIASYPHPCYQFDLILYVGNEQNVAQLDDAGVWSASGLDLPPEDHITALIDMGDDLLTLSNPGDYINKSAVTRWNTYSPSWTIRNKITEVNAYAFLPSDNYVYFVCVDGNIYSYDGTDIALFYNIRNATTTYGHQLTTNLQGKPLVANGGRIYSLYRKNSDMPFALVGEYTCSKGTGATIYSIRANGSNLQVSWGLNGSYGVDEISSNYATAQVVTPRFSRYNTAKVYYTNLNGGSIAIEHKYDKDTSWTAHTIIDDSEDTQCVQNVEQFIIQSGAQARITITPVAGQPSPELDKIEIL